MTTPESLDELARAAGQGDQVALERLLVALAPKLRRFGYRLCRDFADDALQESLLTISQRVDTFAGRGNVASWAYAIVRSACGRQTRGLDQAPKAPLSAVAEQAQSEPGPEQLTIDRERLEALEGALAELPAELREAVLLRDIEQLSAREAARALSISVPALKSRLHRGRRQLAEQLGERHRRGAGAPAASCQHVFDSLERQLEATGEASTLAWAEQHLEDCSECAACCQKLRDALSDCRTAPAADPTGRPWSECVRQLLARRRTGGDAPHQA